jgi:exopolysaccharide biosynthesis polyprenyl glycosylphosphotransferase
VWLRYGHVAGFLTWPLLRVFSVIYLLWLVVLFIHNLFDFSSLRRYTVLFFNLVIAMAVNLLVAVSYFYFQPGLIYTPRRFLLINVAVALLLLLVWHLLLKYFLKNRLTEDLYLFSVDGELTELEKEIALRDYLGFRVLGHLNQQTLSGVNFAGHHGIILPDGLAGKPELLKKFYELRKVGVTFYYHALFYEQLLRKVAVRELTEEWFLENVRYSEKRLYTLCKRLVDMCAGLLGGVLFLVTFPLCALAVKLSSPGPILFVQQRVGQHGRVFWVYKYRTMSGSVSNTWTAIGDPRITPIGRFLRKSRLDELPQCINLIVGNMSLVGPRPEQVHLVEELRAAVPFYDERHLVKPGITGWAQINNVYAANVEETVHKLQYDLYYIKHRSFLFDLEIILKTIYYVFSLRGR